MKTRILFIFGSLLVICNSHAQSPSEPLIVGVTATCKVLDTNFAGSYSGGCKDGLAHGEGVAERKDGSKYVGDFVDGKMHGKGTITAANGNKYEGDFVGGNMHGKGTLTGQDGTKYVGDVVGGKMHGKGTLTMPDGNKYVGDFVGGNMHGKGTFTWSNGDKYEGDWVDDKMHGKGTLTWSNGNKYDGDFANNKPHGKGSKTDSNGTKYVGDFVDGKFQGKASGDAGSLFSLAGNPLLTPDSKDYKGDVRIDANENSLIRVQSELMGIQERRNPRYVYLKLTKKTINQAPNSMRIGATISVIGKYVKNINYRTVGGETKTAPVIECSYLGESNGEESKGMLEQMIKQRESR